MGIILRPSYYTMGMGGKVKQNLQKNQKSVVLMRIFQYGNHL